MNAPKHRKDVPVDACSWDATAAPCTACGSAKGGAHRAEVTA